MLSEILGWISWLKDRMDLGGSTPRRSGRRAAAWVLGRN